MKRPMRVGLTGGIGCGKSAAASEFARLGVPVIDTDVIARELVEPGQSALAEIVEHFGEGVVDPTGTLNREKLRAHIFSHPEARRELEAILHPRIRELALQRAEACKAAYCILVIPLLAENPGDYPLDRILVIDCPRELQRARVASRDRLSQDSVNAMLAAQASRDERLSLADDIIVNDADPMQLKHEVARLHMHYKALAG